MVFQRGRCWVFCSINSDIHLIISKLASKPVYYLVMEDFKSIAILGRQPALGVAELESLYGEDNVMPLGSNSLLKLPTEDIAFKKLGGTLKLARILTPLPSTKWHDIEKYLVEKIPGYMQYVP
jgi:hypothetical protein